jgi:hypothetical protein
MLNENFPSYGNMVLPHTVNEMRTRRLIKIGHPASKEREMAADKVHRSSARERFR